MENLTLKIIKDKIEGSSNLKKSFKKLQNLKENEIKNNNNDLINNLKIFSKKLKQNFENIDIDLKNESHIYDLDLLSKSKLTKKELNVFIRKINEKIRKLMDFKMNLNIDIKINELPLDILNFLMLKRQIKKPQNIHKIIDINKEKLYYYNIEPLLFFMSLKYLEHSQFDKKLKNLLNLDDNLEPKTYDIFENANHITTKLHLTGTTYTFNVQQSDLYKKFLEIENELESKLNFSNFQSIPRDLILKYLEKISEFNSLIEILRDLGNLSISENEIFGFFINLINDFLQDIPTIEGKKVFSEYIINFINLSDKKKQILDTNEIIKLQKNKHILSDEMKRSIKNIEPIEQQDFDENIDNDVNINSTIDDEYLMIFS